MSERQSKPKGEVAELQASLGQVVGKIGKETVPFKRDVFKKVINYMTMGMDMSSLFTQARGPVTAHSHVPCALCTQVLWVLCSKKLDIYCI